MSARGKLWGRRFAEKASTGKEAALTAIDQLYATNIVHHGGGGEDIRDIEGFKQFFVGMFSALPDLHFTVDDMVAEGDKVVTRATFTGTNTGAFKGIPPTNKKFADWEINIARIVDGKVVESWSRADTLGEMQQLGVIPTPKTET